MALIGVLVSVIVTFTASYKLTEAVVGTAKENEVLQCRTVQIDGLTPCEEIVGKKSVAVKIKGASE